MPTRFEPPVSRSDQEFQYMAYGMVAGAVPGVVVGLLLSLSLGNPAMWVSVAAGAGIILGLLGGILLFRTRRKRIRSQEGRTSAAAGPGSRR